MTPAAVFAAVGATAVEAVVVCVVAAVVADAVDAAETVVVAAAAVVGAAELAVVGAAETAAVGAAVDVVAHYSFLSDAVSAKLQGVLSDCFALLSFCGHAVLVTKSSAEYCGSECLVV